MDNIKKDKNNLRIGILAILILEIIALIKGMNGIALSVSLTLIGGLAGYSLRGFVINLFKKNGEL